MLPALLALALAGSPRPPSRLPSRLEAEQLPGLAPFSSPMPPLLRRVLRERAERARPRPQDEGRTLIELSD